MNRVIWILIVSSFLINSGFGFIHPIFAVFVIQNIAGGTLAIVGIATAVFWIIKAIIQIPVARFLDKTPGETDDAMALVVGHLLVGIAAFLYLLAKTPSHVFLIELLFAAGAGISVPAHYGIFTRHIDHFKESFEWSINSSLSLGLGTGVAGAIGGIIANAYGFNSVFIAAGIFAIASGIVIIPLLNHLKRQAQSQNQTK
ncbi:MFS transporter [Candidatus Parcubacteria bacterium]|nr:MAG: MFS transporter [Candidatus Parcubacteria bacterium]